MDPPGKEVKRASGVGALSAHRTPWPLLSPGNPQEGERDQSSPPFPRMGPLPATSGSPALFIAWSPPVPHIHHNTSSPTPFLPRSLVSAPCPSLPPLPTALCLPDWSLVPLHALTVPKQKRPGRVLGSGRWWRRLRQGNKIHRTTRDRGKRSCHQRTLTAPSHPPIGDEDKGDDLAARDKGLQSHNSSVCVGVGSRERAQSSQCPGQPPRNPHPSPGSSCPRAKQSNTYPDFSQAGIKAK